MFDDFDLPPLAAGLEWALEPGNVTTFLAVVEAAALAGDYNDDGVVDAADYTVWRDKLGQMTSLPNETDSLGVVDQADYDAWSANFGAPAGSGSAAVSPSRGVPEPAAVVLVLTALLWFIRRPAWPPIPAAR
jgi:hypothetical protein